MPDLTPVFESERLAALRRTRLLDTPPEPAFDRVTALTGQVLGVPVSWLSLVDGDRQFLKSQHGLPEPWATLRETPLSHSFCALVVASGAPLAVPDARLDDAPCADLAVKDLGILAYLGVPIRSAEGHVLGSLCAIGTEPRTWSEADTRLLADLAAIVESELVLRAELATRHRIEAQYRALFDASPDAVLLLHPTTEVVLDANGGACEAYGRAWADLVGRTLSGTASGVPPALAIASRLDGGDRSVRFESIHQRADGTPFDVAVTAGLVAMDGHDVVFAVVRDVTEHNRAARRLLESSERLRLVHLATTDVIWDWDVAEDTVAWGGRVADTLGWGEAMARTPLTWWADRVHADDRERVVASLRAAAEGEAESWSEEYQFHRADGSFAFVLDRGHVVREPDGRATRVVGSLVDLSERKAFEAELIAAREVAEDAVRLKSSLLKNMSHEIRTPLTAILGYAELIADEAPPALREYATAIGRGGGRLLDTLSSVLDLAQLEGGEFTVRTGSLDLLAEATRAVTAAQALAAQKRLQLSVAGQPTPVRADRTAVARVLRHLVGNAVKFTERGSVTVDVGTSGSRARLRVTDTGIGIAESFLPQVFEAFTQESEGHERTHEGNGLGLAVASRLVAAMGGSIAVESRQGVGSVFTLDLPLAESASA